MKKIQWVAVSVCFVLAVTLWFLVTLNKQTYSTEFDVPLKLVNFPNDLQLIEKFPEEMRVTATGPGIKLLYQDFDPGRDTLKIDFETYKKDGFFLAHQNLAVISKTLKEEVIAIKATPDTVHLRYAVKANKRVPVRLDIEYDFPPSYRVPVGGLEYIDTVTIVGPESALDRIQEVKTRHTVLGQAVEPQVVFLALDSIHSIEMLPNPIRLRYTPKPFTEKAVRLPVRAIGAPLGTTVRFTPDSITVKILTPIDRFESQDGDRIAVEVPFSEIDFRSPFVVPRIQHLPPDMDVVAFSPQLLKYLIIIQE